LGSHEVDTVRELYRSMQEDGLRVGGEYLAAHSTDDTVIRLYTTNGRVLHGRDEVRTFFADAEESGTSVTLRAKTFEDQGDRVVVAGSARVQRAAGGFAETQVRWTWDFRDGLIAETNWEPRAG
jgi:ketosteroid isomerase-like protein